MEKIYLEFKDEKSSKFWCVEWNENSYIVTYGKIGASGTPKITESDNAEADARKLASAKMKKGYVETQQAVVKPTVTDCEGGVSVWFTDFPKGFSAMNYYEFNYDDKDEDGLSQSQFTKDFQIGWFDEDFSEMVSDLEPTNDYESLLEGFEYEDLLLENVEKLTKRFNGKEFTGVMIVGEIFCKNVKLKNDDGTVFFAGSLKGEEDYDF